MVTFAKRLKISLEKRGLSQAEAARQCGISQQTINYIIKNDLPSSKLAPQIASSLGISSEWLIYGHGKFEETKIYEIPLIHSLYMLKYFLKQDFDKNILNYLTTEVDLGDKPFAYLLEPKKVVVCYSQHNEILTQQYLTMSDTSVLVTNERKDFSFPIFEWRIRDVDF